ncbi:MAG TPA: EAL domain-containing protein [Burkholderiaceae bacterium]|jgi:diguanylate cyclase (GGDEF)-like protein/PAS domain S-box-containing protein|nr:EAL domain-containing protein [Burkholderiaceae bacterium]
MTTKLKLLVIEDRETDFRLIERHLRQHGLEADCQRVASMGELDRALTFDEIDAVLLDYHVPGLEIQESLGRIRGGAPALPVILLSGSIGEEAAVELLKQGVWDFVLKDRLARLVPAIERCLQEVAQQAARHSAEEQTLLAAVAFENTLEGIVVADAEHRIVSVNRAFTEITGHEATHLLNRDLTVLSSDRQGSGLGEKMWSWLDEHSSWHGEIWGRRKDGSTYAAWLNLTAVRNSAGRLTHYIGVLTDISERKAAQARIEHMAHHDALTDLPNRALLADRLSQIIAQAQRSNHPVALLFVDLDHFKHINDSLGHVVGDQVLIEVAQRLVRCVRASDTVARLSGDEFVVLLPEAGGVEGVARVVTGVMRAIAEPFQIAGNGLRLSASIGVSLYPKDGREGAELLTNADHAMYHAKAAGRATYRFFSPEMDAQARERFRIESDLREALERRQLRLFYQPLVDSRTGRVNGYEALLRWSHPERGLLSPGAFLTVAEETGLIEPIGEWVLRQACAQCSNWHAHGYDGSVAVNLSARQFSQTAFLDTVKQSLEHCGLPGNFLELELTESLLVEPTEATMKLLHDLRDLGVRLAVDDFGTGYSSFSYLKRYPLNTLKIAQPFVEEVAVASGDRAIVQAMVALARSMRLRTIAEGVEQASQAEALRDLGADMMQGYYFGRPVPASHILVQSEFNRAV